MGPNRHVGGNLKQTNKKHKGERKRTTSAILSMKPNSSKKSMSKKSRRLHAKQQRLIKNSLVTSAQKSSDGPILCLLLPLHESIDLALALSILSKGDSKSSCHTLPTSQDSTKAVMAQYIKCPSLKKEFAFVKGKFDDLFGNLDLARLSDWIIFLLPGDISKMNPDRYSDMMSALYSQGLTASTFVVMSNLSDKTGLLSMLEAKFPVSDGKIRPLNSTNDANALLRYLSQSQKSPTLCSANAYLSTSSALKVGTAATRLRSGVLVEALRTQPNPENEDEVFLQLDGLLRGWGLPLFDLAATATQSDFPQQQRRVGRPFMHLTGWGDFPLHAAEWSNYKDQSTTLLKNTNPILNQWVSDGQEADTMMPDAALADIWGDALNLDDEEDDATEESDGEMAVDSNDDEVQVGDIPPASDDELDLDNSEVDDISIAGGTSRGTAVTFKRNLTRVLNIPVSSSRAEKVKAAKLELQFPDEFETPQGVSARDRFAQYRGLPSFNKCTWPTENDTSLPYEYSKIFRFGNYSHNRRTLMKNTLRQLRELASETAAGATLSSDRKSSSAPPPSHYIPSGSVARLTLGPLPRTLSEAIVSRGQLMPLTLWSLLPYERCISVLHMTMQKRLPPFIDEANEQQCNSDTFDPDPIMAKEPMLFQVGIRRFAAAPIYSQANKAANTNSKVERFFTLASSPIVATVYAPVAYAPQTVLQFRVKPFEDDASKLAVTDFVATGSILSVDPTRAIIKRILLSGHPYKINKRSAVVRYMFHYPDDIEYFKPIQLHTKSGAVGHIKQSVGTHGLMKCLFDRQLAASDVILMPLYKRVFPKMTYDPQVNLKIERINPTEELPQPTHGILKSSVIQKHLQLKEEHMQMAILTPDEEALFA